MATIQNVLLQIHHKVAPTTKRGQKFQDISSATAVVSTSNTTPIVVTTGSAHGVKTGDKVFLYDIVGDAVANNSLANPAWTATRLTATTYSLNGSAAGGGGAGGNMVGCLVGSTDTARFTRQRVLDIYNDARRVFVKTALGTFPTHIAAKVLAGVVDRTANFTFAAGVATLPTGYVAPVLLTDVNHAEIQIIPPSQINRIRDLESATLRYVVERGSQLEVDSAATNVLNANTYILRSYRVAPYTLTDILTKTPATEGIRDIDLPLLVEIADALARGMGNNQALALTQRLLGSAASE